VPLRQAAAIQINIFASSRTRQTDLFTRYLNPFRLKRQ
jgi:hypothetical protein